MNRRTFCGNLDIAARCLRREEAACDRIEFHSSSGVVAERHISTPWRDPDGLRRANVDNIKLERGPGRDPSSVALIGIQSVRQFMALPLDPSTLPIVSQKRRLCGWG